MKAEIMTTTEQEIILPLGISSASGYRTYTMPTSRRPASPPGIRNTIRSAPAASSARSPRSGSARCSSSSTTSHAAPDLHRLARRLLVRPAALRQRRRPDQRFAARPQLHRRAPRRQGLRTAHAGCLPDPRHRHRRSAARTPRPCRRAPPAGRTAAQGRIVSAAGTAKAIFWERVSRTLLQAAGAGLKRLPRTMCDTLTEELMTGLFELFGERRRWLRLRLSHRRLVSGAREYVLSQPDRVISVTDLCEALYVGAAGRAAERLPRGTRHCPVNYLKALRLNAVRRTLRDRDSGFQDGAGRRRPLGLLAHEPVRRRLFRDVRQHPSDTLKAGGGDTSASATLPASAQSGKSPARHACLKPGAPASGSFRASSARSPFQLARRACCLYAQALTDKHADFC